MKTMNTFVLTSFTAALMLVCFLPHAAFASTTKPQCTLTVSTQSGSATIKNSGKILLPRGETMEIAWDSKHTKRAYDDDHKRIALSGTATTSPNRNTTYTYRFENNSKKTECKVAVQVVDGSFNESSLVSMSTKPKLSGTAEGQRTVQVAVYGSSLLKPLYISKTLNVKNGKWNLKLNKSLKKGTYTVALRGDRKALLNTLATSTLEVGVKPDSADVSASDTTFYIESVPLLHGGIAKAGTAVPVAYLQVINIGKSTGALKSFSIQQNGNASTDVIAGFTVSNNRSTSTVSVGNVQKPITFKNNTAVLPVHQTINTGQMALFTIKAVLNPQIGADFLKQLKLDVTGYNTNGKQKGAFPIRGTTWTLGY